MTSAEIVSLSVGTVALTFHTHLVTMIISLHFYAVCVLVHGQVTIIFVVSVSVGLSVCLLICLFVQFFSAVIDPISIN